MATKKEGRKAPADAHDKQALGICPYNDTKWHGDKMCKACQPIAQSYRDNAETCKTELQEFMLTMETPLVTQSLIDRCLGVFSGNDPFVTKSVSKYRSKFLEWMNTDSSLSGKH